MQIKDYQIIKKLITIIGITNATFGSILGSKTLIIFGGTISIIGTLMILNILK